MKQTVLFPLLYLKDTVPSCVDGPLLTHQSWRDTYNFELMAKTENWMWLMMGRKGHGRENIVQRMKIL